MPAKSFKRTDRVSAQLRRDLGELVHAAVRNHGLPSVSVSDVEVTRDLAHAKVFVTALDPVRAGEALAALKELARELRFELGRRVRFLDRFFDLYVMNNMSAPVFDALRPEGKKDPYGVERAMARLGTAYDWLEANLGDGPWAVGDEFTMADCAAAPSLFYADWVQEIGADRPQLSAYRARLLAHPIIARAVDEARPYRAFFPLGAPDRD